MPRSPKPLTDPVIKTLKAPRGSKAWSEFADGGCRGLRLRVSPKGEQVWVVRLLVRGRRVRHTLGSYPAVGLGEARKRAREFHSAGREGDSPEVVEERKRAEKLTVIEAHAEYIEAMRPALKARTLAIKQGLFSDHVTPVIGSRLLRTTRRGDVVEVVDAVRKKGLIVQANRVFSEVMALLRWAEQRHWIEVVPSFPKGRGKTRERPRDRTLTDAELAEIWRAADRIGPTSGDFVRLLLLTGQRRDEVRLMRWDEVDLDAQLWTISAKRYKTHVDHVVPLSDPATEILAARKVSSGNGYVLKGRADKAPFNAAISALRRLRRQVDGARDFVLHDLRRTCRTGLSRLGVDEATAELVIGHVPQGIVKVYDRHARLEERRAALEKWAEFVLRLAGERGDNVVLLRGVAQQ